MLPSVLMESLARCLEANLEETARQNTSPPEDNSGSTVSTKDLRILIAEDNMVNQKVLSKIMGRLGISRVEIVDNGQKAVEREAAEPFDVVLMDIQMPVMSGIDAARLICQRQGGHTKAKVVFVTAHAFESFEAECHDAGGYSFLTKPCRIDDVQACLEKVCRLTENGA